MVTPRQPREARSRTAPDQGEAGGLAGEPADDLGPAAGLAEGPLDEVRVPDPVVVLGGEPQVGGEPSAVGEQAFHRRRAGDLGLQRGLHQQPRAETGHLLQDLRQSLVLSEQLVDLAADRVGRRYSVRLGRRSFPSMTWPSLRGTYARLVIYT
jgi:hypothetical protein